MKHTYFPFMSLVVFVVFTAISISTNPWFSIFSNAYSDLGNPSNTSSFWIFNIGLVFASVFWFYFGLKTFRSDRWYGGIFILFSSIFFALIGIFHEGTKYHYFVSYAFFISAFIGLLIYEFKNSKFIAPTIFILAIIGQLIPFPSIALFETYEIILLSLFVILVYKKEERKKSLNHCY